MSKCFSLPGIRKVWYIPRSFLPDDVVFRAAVGIPVVLTQAPTELKLNGEAVCEVEQSFDNNCCVEKVKLSFSSLDTVPTTDYPAFVIKTADEDRLYLIGSKERPYPTVKVSSSTGLPDGDAHASKYEVSFTARKALALIQQ